MFTVAPPTLREVSVNAGIFQARVILYRPKETGDLPRQGAYSFATAVEGRSNKGKGKGFTEVRSFLVYILSEVDGEHEECHCEFSVRTCYGGIPIILVANGFKRLSILCCPHWRHRTTTIVNQENCNASMVR